MFASVVVNVPSSNVDKYYEYHVPESMTCFIAPGERCHVSFGQANRAVMGYILDVYEEQKYHGTTKEIIELLDLSPVINEESLQLAKFIRNDTICPLTRILNLMIPDALVYKTIKSIALINPSKVDATILKLFDGKNELTLTPKINEYANIIKKEIAKGNLKYAYDIKQATKPMYYYTLRINPNLMFSKDIYNDDAKLTFLEEYRNEPKQLTKDEILDKYDISLYMLEKLITMGYLEKEYHRFYRNALKNKVTSLFEIRELNDSDIEVINEFEDYSKPYLYIPQNVDSLNSVLCGLISKQLDKDLTSVIICADILSSYKYASIIRKTLGVSVALINSNMTSGEYLDTYELIKEDAYRVIVTTPKGAFLPFKNVGMYFMLDEESDNYYNDQSPRYDLKKIFYYKSYKKDVQFILESRSPSVSSYFYALKGIYQIVNDSTEFTKQNVEVVDMKKELLTGNSSYLSNKLKNALKENVKQKKKSLLIVNNRSYSTYCLCRMCGDVPKCPYCEISLNYNESKNILICPACAYREEYVEACKKCGSKIKYFGGIGTQSLLELVNNYLPDLKTEVLDTNNQKDYFEKISLIEENKCDLLITTETFASSLPSLNIGLIGVVSLDSTLKIPSYDANSRAYCMLLRLSHLLNEDGQMIVQTSYPDASPLVNFIKGEFMEFMKSEITSRKAMHNEPFYHINRIVIKGKYEEIYKVANSIRAMLKELAGNKVFVIGPTYSKTYGGTVLIIKHNYSEINKIYHRIYEHYQESTVDVIFDKYPRKL